MDIKYSIIRECVKNKSMIIEYTSTELMIVNFLLKVCHY